MRSPFGKTLLVLIGFGLLIAGYGWLSWRSELQRLRSTKSVLEETGLRLPEHARITATRAHLFSLADGDNYEWLIECESNLLQWAAVEMKPEPDGWERARYLAEFGFSDEMPSGVKFGGVWRTHRRTERGHDEESYLYLADDGKVGILVTFRP